MATSVADAQTQLATLTQALAAAVATYQQNVAALTVVQKTGSAADIAAAQARVDASLTAANNIQTNVNTAKTQLALAQDLVNITNPSQSAAATQAKYQAAKVVGDTSSGNTNSAQAAGPSSSSGSLGQTISSVANAAATGFAVYSLLSKVANVPLGAENPVYPPARVNINSQQTNLTGQDMRVRIKVPTSYLTPMTSGLSITPQNNLSRPLLSIGGIIFPYTPTISQEYTADYTSANPTHSNYNLYFYKNSKVSPINITGKFTVQNDQDAEVFMATVHLLRSLTKMHFGGQGGDSDSGAPPPVCRLFAYGDYMFDNTPVVVSQFRLELPDGVDYFTLGKNGIYSAYGSASVPVVSTIAVTLLPVYSRAEMQKFNVRDYLSNKQFRHSGYL